MVSTEASGDGPHLIWNPETSDHEPVKNFGQGMSYFSREVTFSGDSPGFGEEVQWLHGGGPNQGSADFSNVCVPAEYTS